MKKILFSFVFLIFLIITSFAQDTLNEKNFQVIKDTITYKVAYNSATKYLDDLFSKRNIDSASSFWTYSLYFCIKNDWNYEGQINDKETVNDIFKSWLEFLDSIKQRIKLIPIEKSIQLFKLDKIFYFIIDFKIGDNIQLPDNLNNPLNYVFTSEDGGKSWKVNQDEWFACWVHNTCNSK